MAGAPQETPRGQRELRLTGIVEAIHSSKAMVPQIVGQNGRLTLTRLIANGSRVKEGDVIAEFDPTQQLDAAFTARAKYEDLGHQVDQKTSQNRADAEKRRGDLTQAEADLRKAELEGDKTVHWAVDVSQGAKVLAVDVDAKTGKIVATDNEPTDMSTLAKASTMSFDELVQAIKDVREEQFNLRFQHATGELENSARIGIVRRDVARLLTVAKERGIDLQKELRH